MNMIYDALWTLSQLYNGISCTLRQLHDISAYQQTATATVTIMKSIEINRVKITLYTLKG